MGGVRFDAVHWPDIPPSSQIYPITDDLYQPGLLLFGFLPTARIEIWMDFRRISCGKRSTNDKVISGEMVTTESKYRVHVFVPRRQDRFR
jgi:hypothetical protein